MKRRIALLKSIEYRKRFGFAKASFSRISVFYGRDASGDGGCAVFEMTPHEWYRRSGKRVCAADGVSDEACVYGRSVNSGTGGISVESGNCSNAFGSEGVRSEFHVIAGLTRCNGRVGIVRQYCGWRNDRQYWRRSG